MLDERKPRTELLAELAELRHRVAQLEAAEAERVETEKEYRSLLEACPDAVMMSDLEGRVLFASPQTYNLFGLDRDLDLRGHNIFDHVAEDERERAASNILDLTQVGVHQNNEYRALRQDGSSVAVEVSSAIIRDDTGQPKAAMAVIRDVSERKKVEEALHQSHDELRAIYDAVVDGLIVVDIENRHCIRTNPQMARMLGYSLEELPRDAAAVHRPEDMPAIVEKFRAQAEGRMSVAENIPFLHKDGSIVYADISGSRIDYNGRPCVISFVRDVTQRKRAEEALRASEERFRAVFEEAPVGIVIANSDRKISRVNRAFCRMLGYEPEELIGQSVQAIMHPEDRDVSTRLVDKLQAGEIPSFTVERRYVRRNGEVVWTQATTTGVHGPDGKLDLGLGIVEDIDERKRAREALQREHRTLWHMLRSSDHERQLIAYEIHDGLAQQLAAALMQFQTYEHLKEREPENASLAYDAGVQMLRQAHFEARRLISGVRPPILDESGIVAALAHLVHDQRMIGGPKIEFQSDVEFDRLTPVLENAIYRIAQEAVTNACKHGKGQKVRVRLLQEKEEQVRLEVQDWGVGFDPAAVGQDSFGLEGIRERTRFLGGAMTLETQPGKGTCIRVVLPLLTNEE